MLKTWYSVNVKNSVVTRKTKSRNYRVSLKESREPGTVWFPTHGSGSCL